jgi:hypothetical protein
MFRYADPTACPRCRADLGAGDGGCARCGALLDDARAYDVFLALQQVDRLVSQLVDRPVATAGPSAPPVAPALPRPALSGVSVPRILLGLGALCLVVAALVFLVVAWASLGVGGRTAVLVGFTLVSAGLATWSARTGLRAGAEALTSVAFGLLVLDLAGARTSGWIGDVDARGFALLTGGVLVVVGAAATIAARRTKEPRLLSAEVATSLGVVALVGALAEPDAFTDPAWILAACALSSALAAASRQLRLGIATWTAASMVALTWLGLAGIGLSRLLACPTWRELVVDLQAWPLLAAAAIAAGPGVARALPTSVRAAGAAVAVLLATLPAVVPALDEGVVGATLALVAVTAGYAAVGWLLPARWAPVAVAPVVLAGTGVAVAAGVAALHALAALLDHGLWTGTATGSTPLPELERIWTALLPLAIAALGAAAMTLARVARVPVGPTAMTSAAALMTSLAIAPALFGVPFWLAVGVLGTATAASVAWSLRTGEPYGWLAAAPCALLALGAALVDDGLTITVLSAATIACARGESRRTPDAVRAASTWALPAVAGATTWAIAAALGISGEWRAAPVVVLALVAVLRDQVAHEAVGLGTALVAIGVGAGLGPLDLRIVAAQLTATALVATYLGVRRRPDTSLPGLALLAGAAVAAWPDAATAAAVLATTTAIVLLHEVRRVEPAALVARSALPVALGALFGPSASSPVWRRCGAACRSSSPSVPWSSGSRTCDASSRPWSSACGHPAARSSRCRMPSRGRPSTSRWPASRSPRRRCCTPAGDRSPGPVSPASRPRCGCGWRSSASGRPRPTRFPSRWSCSWSGSWHWCAGIAPVSGRRARASAWPSSPACSRSSPNPSGCARCSSASARSPSSPSGSTAAGPHPCSPAAARSRSWSCGSC